MNCYWLLNHDCTDEQEMELKERFGVESTISPSLDFRSVWCSLPCGCEVDREIIRPWIEAINPPDIAVVQGDSTYAFCLVDALLAKGVRVFASTTERIASERRDDKETIITRLFRHASFREYIRY